MLVEWAGIAMKCAGPSTRAQRPKQLPAQHQLPTEQKTTSQPLSPRHSNGSTSGSGSSSGNSRAREEDEEEEEKDGEEEEEEEKEGEEEEEEDEDHCDGDGNDDDDDDASFVVVRGGLVVGMNLAAHGFLCPQTEPL